MVAPTAALVGLGLAIAVLAGPICRAVRASGRGPGPIPAVTWPRCWRRDASRAGRRARRDLAGALGRGHPANLASGLLVSVGVVAGSIASRGRVVVRPVHAVRFALHFTWRLAVSGVVVRGR